MFFLKNFSQRGLIESNELDNFSLVKRVLDNNETSFLEKKDGTGKRIESIQTNITFTILRYYDQRIL